MRENPISKVIRERREADLCVLCCRPHSAGPCDACQRIAEKYGIQYDEMCARDPIRMSAVYEAGAWRLGNDALWEGKPPPFDEVWHQRVYDLNKELADELRPRIALAVAAEESAVPLTKAEREACQQIERWRFSIAVAEGRCR